MLRNGYLLVLTMVLVMPSLAQDSLNVICVGSLYIGWDYEQHVAVQGHYAYLANHNYVQIIDIGDPTNPIEVSRFGGYGTALDVAVAGNYAYILSRDQYRSYMHIYDINDPYSPELLGNYIGALWISFNAITISGNYAFIASDGVDIPQRNGLLIIDINNPVIPVETGHCWFAGDPQDVQVIGNYAFVATGGGLSIVEISDPLHPSRVTFYDTPGWAVCVAILNDIAYIAEVEQGEHGLCIIDVSDPIHPIQIGYFETQDNANGIVVYENYAYIADHMSGLRIIDISSPDQPVETGYYDTPGISYNVALSIPYAYLADCEYFRIFDCSQAINYPPPIIFIIPLQSNYFELISTNLLPVNLNAAIVFRGVNALEIIYQNNGNIYRPGVINTIGDISVNQGYRIFVSEESEWTVEGQLLDPETEYVITASRWNWIGYPYDTPVPVQVALAEIEGGYRIVQTDDGRIWIPSIPINTLGNMQPGEGYMIFPTEDATFRYHSEVLLAAGSSWTTSSPGHPTLYGQPRTADRTLYEVLILPEVDDAPPATGLPYAVLVRLSDDLKTQNPMVIELYDHDLLVGKGAIPEQCLDEDIPVPLTAWRGSPELGLPGFTTGHPIMVRALASDGEILADMITMKEKFGEGAYTEITLDVLDLAAVPSEFSVGLAYPNPFNQTVTVPYSLPIEGDVRFALFNILGQQVYSTTQHHDAGQYPFNFDAALTKGDLVSGLYFVQVWFADQVRTQKVVLLR